MLNFLRKLRRNNMKGKYLKYAIGEIILVVIGILIALSVNNWNEERKKNLKGEELYKNLVSELEGNAKYYQKSLDGMDMHISFLDTLMKSWNLLSLDHVRSQIKYEYAIENLGIPFYMFSFSHFLDPSQDIYNPAINNGSIALLKNRKFVQELDKLYNGVLRINQFIDEEYALGREINQYISVKYETIFATNSPGELWTTVVLEHFFKAIRNDGILRFKIGERIALKTTRRKLIEGMLVDINTALQYNNR